MFAESPIRILKVALFGLAFALSCPQLSDAQEQRRDVDAVKVSELPILIVDSHGQPIPEVKIIPWALGSGQGHGTWGPFEGKPDESGMEPETVETDENGLAIVRYPFFRSALEKTRTLIVSVSFEHPDFSHDDTEHINVPLTTDGPYRVVMNAAASIEIRPLMEGQPVALDDLNAIWSDRRSWQAGSRPKKLSSGKLRIDGLFPGTNSFLVVRMVEDKVTHFSEIEFLDLEEGSVSERDVSLKPAVRVIGKLSENVPRPVSNGRVVARSLSDSSKTNGTMWIDWAPVAEDGSFVFEAWPDGIDIQLIALCDGFIATSGRATSKELEFPKDGYHRPHAFDIGKSEIVVPMMPLVPVKVTVTDENDAPVSGLDVATSPNVGWWNYGSQIYAIHLVQGRNLVREREYQKVIESPFPSLFRGLTDSRGQVTFQLPPDMHYLEVLSEEYELPIELGQRARAPIVEEGKPLDIAIRVQPIGTEQLGDWDKLAGVVYGCSTIEGRRFLALPGMKEKAEAFVERFSEAKNQQDPAMLAEAYLILASAFLSAGEEEEAFKWRQKANEQQSK